MEAFKPLLALAKTIGTRESGGFCVVALREGVRRQRRDHIEAGLN
jgi:hypothetical protein